MSRQKSKTTSELLRTKTKLSDGDKKTNKRNITNLNEIESVLNELEINNVALNEEVRRICNCMARRHPLFEIAPNCLSCGKIICTKEGLQPCSFCGADIIPTKDRDAIKSILEKERNELLHSSNKQQTPIQSINKPRKKIVVKMNPGEKFWEAQDRAFKLAEQEIKNEELAKLEQQEQQEQEHVKALNKSKLDDNDSDLVKAQEKLETLLNYQETGEERTRIIDNAADFELPTQSIWLSPEERALNLKKQQRMLKENQIQQERNARGEKHVEMVIKDGKVSLVERAVPNKVKRSDEEVGEVVKKNMDKRDTNNESMWDYDEDKKKWKKLRYFSNKNDENNLTSDQNINDKITKSRLQFDKNNDPMELLVSMF
ncbi:uncharacterized protein KGF55_002478 [Candida pseudojiufengensis]|uniref:uncharacterized protein n=1 Tax=Candida pseudojiufengensis TaxID=497109 RepID=UPI0022243883|nr:uncharacterized protein KGF55_002478 [Candida pseudojiufengensis]KAI5963598.1 hypothetical protein KGF55_002478 [Candida pseudojiufengensis]